MNVTIKESIKEFDGWLHLCQHHSNACECDMNFSLYLPPQAEHKSVPCVYFLSGLTCSDENFRVKAGAQRYAAELGIALVIPDTSPRGEHIPDDENYYIGQGAGFYLSATQVPWHKNYHMDEYIVNELPKAIASMELAINDKKSITGFSMGGHGALILALKNPKNYVSVSAFSPICNPINGQWGQDAFSAYLGEDKKLWSQFDACTLIENGHTLKHLLIDQGISDEFYPDQLLPENLEKLCKQKDINLNLNLREGYDHSFHFVASFIGEHLKWHSKFLNK